MTFVSSPSLTFPHRHSRVLKSHVDHVCCDDLNFISFDYFNLQTRYQVIIESAITACLYRGCSIRFRTPYVCGAEPVQVFVIGGISSNGRVFCWSLSAHLTRDCVVKTTPGPTCRTSDGRTLSSWSSTSQSSINWSKNRTLNRFIACPRKEQLARNTTLKKETTENSATWPLLVQNRNDV